MCSRFFAHLPRCRAPRIYSNIAQKITKRWQLKVSKSQRRKINDFKLNICHFRDNLLLFSLLMLISMNTSKFKPFFIRRRGKEVVGGKSSEERKNKWKFWIEFLGITRSYNTSESNWSMVWITRCYSRSYGVVSSFWRLLNLCRISCGY